jgi:DNA adenine methylase
MIHTSAKDQQRASSNRTAWAAPVLRWAGSKRKLLPELMSSAAAHPIDLYVEPFAGSACLFFALRPRAAVLSDVNLELIHFYQVLKQHPRLLARRTSNYGSEKRTYYRIRKQRPSELSAIERAGRFLYLNRHCFNGIYRANNKGEFNVPMGKRTGSLPSEPALVRAACALRRASISVQDFEQAGVHARPRTFFYLDPPYDYSGRSNRGEYGPGTFNIDDLERLSKLLVHIDENGARFLLSYLSTPEIKNIASRWICRSFPVRRQVASFNRFRVTIEELLISNFPL